MKEIDVTAAAQAYFNNVQTGIFTEAELQTMLLGLGDLGDEILTAYQAIKNRASGKGRKTQCLT